MPMKRIMLFTMVIFVLLLTACSTKNEAPATSKEILTRVEKVHENIETLFVNQEIVETLGESLTYKATEQHDFTNEVYFYQIDDEDIFSYKDKGELLIVAEGVQFDPTHDYTIFQNFKIDYEIESQKNPLKHLTKFDKNFYDNLSMKENKKSYIFTYNGNDEEKLAILQGIMWSNNLQANTIFDSYEEIDFTDVSIEITASTNKETNYIEFFKTVLKFTFPEEFNNHRAEVITVNKYSKFNEPIDLEVPNYLAFGSEIESTIEDITFSDDEVTTYEKEAGEYVDALIQATVFQNIEEYVKRVPGPKTEEENREDASFQQSSFRSIYEQNTMRNMEGTGVTEEQVKDYSSAFLNAIATTNYEVTNAKMEADDSIKVTLSISGINNSLMNYEVGEILNEELEAGKLEEKDILDRNIELIIDLYNSNEDVIEPMDAVVDVMRNEDGTYMVLLQDQYLLTFVQ